MNLDKETVTHVLGDSHIDIIRQFAEDIEYEKVLKKKVEKISNIIGFTLYGMLLYFLFTHTTKPMSIFSYIWQSFVILIIFATVYDSIIDLLYKLVTKVIFKKHFYNVKQRKVIYLANKNNQYELLKPLAYLIEPNEETDSTDSYSIKSQFIRYRYSLMNTLNSLNSSSTIYHSIEESFINMYLELHDYSKRVDAYVGEQEWQHPDYLELKQHVENIN